jgi:hypothetical protein
LKHNPSIVFDFLFFLFQAMKLDLDYKDEKLSALNKEIDELQVGGGATGEEVSALKRQRHELELKLKDQVRMNQLEKSLRYVMDFNCFFRRRSWTTSPVKSRCWSRPRQSWRCQWQR